MISHKEAIYSVEIDDDLYDSESDTPTRSSTNHLSLRFRAEDKKRNEQLRSLVPKKTRRPKTSHDVQNKQQNSFSSVSSEVSSSECGPSSGSTWGQSSGGDPDSMICLSDNVTSESKDLRLDMTEGAGEMRGERQLAADIVGSEAGEEDTNWQQIFHTTVANNSKHEGTTWNNNNQLMDDRNEVCETYDRNVYEHNGRFIPSDKQLVVDSSHIHAELAFQNEKESNTEVGCKCSSADNGAGTEKLLESNNCEIQACVDECINLPNGQHVDNYKTITCYSRIEASTCSIETCINAIRITSLTLVSQHFAVLNVTINAIKLTVTFTKPLAIKSSSFALIKSHPNNQVEYPEQESQLGYESHLTRGVMVNGSTVVSSMISMGSLRGDKASRSHNSSAFGSLRSKSGLEQFCNSHNEATFAHFRENKHVNYAHSSYRAEIVGASSLTGVYSESDAAHKSLDHKHALCIKNDSPTQDQKLLTGTFKY